jgi:hypothetical protein
MSSDRDSRPGPGACTRPAFRTPALVWLASRAALTRALRALPSHYSAAHPSRPRPLSGRLLCPYAAYDSTPAPSRHVPSLRPVVDVARPVRLRTKPSQQRPSPLAPPRAPSQQPRSWACDARAFDMRVGHMSARSHLGYGLARFGMPAGAQWSRSSAEGRLLQWRNVLPSCRFSRPPHPVKYIAPIVLAGGGFFFVAVLGR